jgi:hypothetical protein
LDLVAGLALLMLPFILAISTGRSLAQPGPPEVELEGTVEVLHEDRDVGSRYVYFLQTATERLELLFASDPPALESGDRIRAKGLRTNGVLALTSGSSTTTLSSGLKNTFGVQKTLVILVNFQNDPKEPYTVSSATGVMDTTSNHYLEGSYQQTSLDGTVVGWYTIEYSSNNCDYNKIASFAEQAAAANGVDVSSYPRRVYAFPKNACTWWGLGTVGGNPSRAWINGTFSLKVVGHEAGHNHGLYHSRSLECGSVVLASNCTINEYGDSLDIMGNPSSGHFNAFQKERLGWLNYDISPPITAVQADGVYWVAPYEANNSDPKALKILKSTDSTTGKSTYYYVEHRTATGFDSFVSSNGNVLSGVVIHTGSESSANSSYLLDMTADTSSWNDPALVVGQSYSDPDAGVTITVLSADSLGASVSVTFAGGGGGGGTTCVQSNPTVSISPSGTQSVLPGALVSYTVSVANNDNSSCSSSTFNLSAAVPSGWTGSLGSASLSVSPGASASTTLQVTSSGSAAPGSYSVGVTATDSASPSYSGSASVTVEVQSVCQRANPSVAVSPAIQWVIGGTGSYSVTVTNNDNSSCAASSFNLSAALPSGWDGAFGSSALSVAAGASSSTSLTVTAPTGTPDGFYSFSVTATNSAATAYSGSSSVLQVCCSGILAVKVSTDKSSYPQNSWVTITVNVRVGQSPVAGASVNITIQRQGANVATLRGTTDGSGNLVIKWKLAPNAPTGAYQVLTAANASGYTGNNNTATFQVTKRK